MMLAKKLAHYGSWALITGASSGVGKGFAKLLAQNKINLVLISEDEDGLKETVNEVKNINAIEINTIVCDFRNPNAVDRLLENSVVIQCNIIINCAGVGLVGYFIQHNLKDYHNMLEVNLNSLLKITYFFCKRFYEAKIPGAIINVSSANAELHSAVPFSAVYSAEKSMIKYFTEAVAFEMEQYGIDLLCVSCGPVKTAFQKKSGTNVLSWCETPDEVAIKSLNALGKKQVIITNPRTRWLIGLNRVLILPRQTRLKIIAWFFGKVLAKADQVKIGK